MSKNIGPYITSRAGGSGSATAAGSGDNTEVDGAWVNRRDTTANDMFDSAKLVITYRTTLTAAKTLSFAVNIQDATDDSGTGAADYGTALAATVVKTGALTDARDTLEFDFDLSGANQFVRAQVTPDLSNTATDTVDWQAVWVFGANKRVPVSKSVIAL